LSVDSVVCAATTAQKEIQRGELLLFKGNINGAIKAFKRAIAIDPKRWDAHLNLVAAYSDKNDFPAAIEECMAVLKVRPDHKDTRLLLGDLLRVQAWTEIANTYLAIGELQESRYASARAREFESRLPKVFRDNAPGIFRTDVVEFIKVYENDLP
jgi:tetratricopeptide (TPR) repeat protein